ncbi:hypothetical protein TWF225_008052 [Orbilia oligospora]|nr:hypothetical protein TWF225_008052 [Orbilia oligospora]KAF3239812.1 hypothetical protein TWF128_011695 [Orbilia oligospora]KAF3248009.1 hypothetical protein TWF217_009467 [Orbilia oligospora]
MEGNTKPPTQETPGRSNLHILSLPNEIQAQILSNLSINDQINAFKEGVIFRVYHSPNIHPIPDSETPVGFIWLFTEELRENEMHDDYFDVTDSPFLNETTGTPFSYYSHSLKPTTREEKVLLGIM